MNNFLKIILVFIFINNCSSPFTKKEIEEKEQNNIIEVLKKEKNIDIEFNPNLKITLKSKTKSKSFLNNFENNNGRTAFDGDLKIIKKLKFSKIKNFKEYDPTISFYNNNIIFFDKKGSILMFNNDAELIWKKNNYTKSEKKQNPILFFANNKKIIVIADNITKYYALDIVTGELIWSKNNTTPFNSQIKIYKDKFFVVDLQNVLRAYSIKDGKEIWNIKTNNSLIRSQKKLSMVIIKGKVFFNNYSGDISAVDIESGELLWQTPTQSNLVTDKGFLLKTSDIIADNERLYFSNNKNQFFSLDMQTGNLNWMQQINSNLRPIVVDKFIITISNKGFLYILDRKIGNIIRINDLHQEYKSKNKKKIFTTGFFVARNKVYLTNDDGKLIVADLKTGNIISTNKISGGKILQPYLYNNNLFIIKNGSIIKYN